MVPKATETAAGEGRPFDNSTKAHCDDAPNKSSNQEDEHFRHQRAQGHWNFLKNLNNRRASLEQKALYKSGEKISLTTTEATFLTMLAKAKLDMDHAGQVEDKEIQTASKSEENDGNDQEGKPKQSHGRSGKDNYFVDLVKAAVAKERLKDSISERLSHLSGPEVKFLTKLVNSDDVSMEALENAVSVLDNDPMYNPALRPADSDEEDDAKSKGAEDRRSKYQRRSSTVEKSMWKLSTVGIDVDDLTEQDESTVGSAGALDQNSGMKKINISDLGVAIDDKDTMSLAEDAIVQSLTTTTGGDNELPAPGSDETSKKSAKSARLEELLAHHRQKVTAKAEDIKAPIKVTMERASSYLCCAIGSSFGDNDLVKSKDQDATETDENDDSSLQAKIRYLHLNTNAALDRHAHLSTWLGSPEDYPILGLGDMKTEQGKEEQDPLDPHVLSPLLMKCLRDHLPWALREENFWLKYSLVRDHTILAIETLDGEVLGSFTSTPWRNNGNNFYGSCEAFVWNLRKKRRNPDGQDSCSSLDEYILRESSLEVFLWDHKGNRNIQLSSTKKLFVGGGQPEEQVMENVQTFRDSGTVNSTTNEQWGMAIALDKELLHGTSSKCATFGGSSPLIDSARHEGSS